LCQWLISVIGAENVDNSGTGLDPSWADLLP
jgi:hypothetical protein